MFFDITLLFNFFFQKFHKNFSNFFQKSPKIKKKFETFCKIFLKKNPILLYTVKSKNMCSQMDFFEMRFEMAILQNFHVKNIFLKAKKYCFNVYLLEI